MQVLTQPTLFDLRQAALDLVERHADPAWMGGAITTIYGLSILRESFTSDDVWENLARAGLTTHEPRAMGPVLKYAQRKGWIVPTGEWIASNQKQNHGRMIRVWRGANHAATLEAT